MSTGIRKAVKKTGGSTGIRPPASRRAPAAAAAAAAAAARRPQPAPRAPPQPQPADTQSSTDYTLMSAPRERTHNVMRMLTPKPVDFEQFTPPIRMRRQNRDYYRVKNRKRNEEEAEAEAEAEQLEEERPKVDMNLIADAGGARRNKRNLFKKRTKQVYFADEEKRRLDIEEARPWILEDDEEKEVWTGELEGGQSSEYVLFVLAEDGFRVVPVDRWYKFAPKLKYNTMTLDEAEEELQRMQKAHAKRDLWIMHRRNQQEQKKQEQQQPGGPSLGAAKSSLVEYESYAFSDDEDKQGRSKDSGKHGGLDEIEFEMEFEDDEELGDVRFEYNEEEESNRQRERAHTSMFASDDEDDDLFGDKPGDSKDAKQLRKLMRKREGNVDYESDREENPYLSEEESSDESDHGQKPAEPQKPAESEPRPAEPKPAAASAKKRKRLSVAPHHAAHPASPTDHSRLKHHKSAAAVKPSSPSAALITKQEIIELIRSGVSDIRELISHVRKKLQANPENRKRIHEMLKEVATYKNNKLTLKKP